jgi:hypothetical protein
VSLSLGSCRSRINEAGFGKILVDRWRGVRIILSGLFEAGHARIGDLIMNAVPRVSRLAVCLVVPALVALAFMLASDSCFAQNCNRGGSGGMGGRGMMGGGSMSSLNNMMRMQQMSRVNQQMQMRQQLAYRAQLQRRTLMLA